MTLPDLRLSAFPFRGPTPACLALVVIALAVTSTSVSAQIVIRERVEVAPPVAPVGAQARAGSGAEWSFTEGGDFRLVLRPRFMSGGTVIEQCYFSRSHSLRVTYLGSREGEVDVVNLGSLITDQYDSWYPGWAPGCDDYVAYGFGGSGASEVVLELGEVAAGDRVAIEHVFGGNVIGGLVDPVVFPDTPRDLNQTGDGGVWTWGRYAFFDSDPSQSSAGLRGLRAEFVEAPASLELSLDRDTVLVSESVAVTIEGVTDPDAVVSLSAVTPHGRLVRVVGTDTTQVTGSLEWSEIEGAEILFVADGNWPDQAVEIIVEASVVDSPTDRAEVTLLAPELELDLDVDPATYLPIKGDTLTATVRLHNVPDGLRSEVSVDLVRHYEFAFIDGTSGARVLPLARDAAGRDTASVELLSKAWWGVASLEASLQGKTPSDTLAAEVHVPIDEDGDTIADSWEMLPANGGRLDLGGVVDDRDWDEDMGQSGVAPGDPGDLIRKEDEYRGVLIDSVHVRLSPKDREMLLDLSASTEGTAITSGLSSVEVVPILFSSSVVSLSAVDPVTGDPRSRPLRVAPDSNAPSSGSQGQRGIVYVNGALVATTPTGGFDGPLLGFANPQSVGDPGYDKAFRSWRPETYGSTIQNIWTANSAPEAGVGWTLFPIAETSGPTAWWAAFTNVDLDGDGTFGLVNPLDAVSSQPGPQPGPTGTPPPPTTSALNNPIDTIIGSMAQADVAPATSLHEVGHTIGLLGVRIGPPSLGHPQSGDDVMRSGIGPAKVQSFNATKPSVSVKLSPPGL